MIQLRTFAIAAIGALTGWFLGIPLPFLLGPMFACLIAGLGGLQLRQSGVLGEVMRTILGVAVGASITPDLVSRLPDMAASVLLVPVFLALVGFAGYRLLHRIFGFDKATSFYGAMPGGLQDMLLFGEAAGAEPRQLSLLQATRIVVVVTVMPFLLVLAFDLDLTSAPGQPALSTPPEELVAMVVCALAGWQIAKRLGLFGASILGPMFLTAAASLADIIHVRPPAEAIIAAQFFIGLGIGAKYTGITFAEVRHVVMAALAYCLVIALIAGAFALIVTSLGLASAPAALMAFSPGGQAEMAVLAIVAGVDVAFVVAHHMLRLILVITLAPIVAKRLILRE